MGIPAGIQARAPLLGDAGLVGAQARRPLAKYRAFVEFVMLLMFELARRP